MWFDDLHPWNVPAFNNPWNVSTFNNPLIKKKESVQ